LGIPVTQQSLPAHVFDVENLRTNNRSCCYSETNPSDIYAHPESSEIVAITHLEFGRATHRAAHLMRPNREGSDSEVVALIGQSDTISYHAILVGP
jgi:hypothetical protein